MVLLPMLTLSQTSSEPTLIIRDTLPDGRAFYIDIVNDPIEGSLMRFNDIGYKQIRIINNDRIAAQKENILLKEDILDCEKEKELTIKKNNSLTTQNQELNSQYTKEKEKHSNTTIMMNGYKKQATTGKIVIVIGGVSIAVGVGLVVYSVIKTSIN